MIRGVDLASYQGAPDFEALHGGGIDFAITKMTEGTVYTFGGARRNRAEALRVGMVSGLYHFARGVDPRAEADYFLNAAGPLTPGEFLCLDWEISSPDPVGWALTWLNTVYARTGLRPFIYLNGSTVARLDWGPVASPGYPLWLAKYDGTQAQPNVPHFLHPVIKQYSDIGRVPGISGNVDLDVAFCSADQLRFYGQNPATPPAPQVGPDSLPSLKYGDRGPSVASLQRFLNAYGWVPPLPLLPTTGNYLDQTVSVLRAAQGQCGIRGGDGRNVGPQTKQALWARGWRG